MTELRVIAESSLLSSAVGQNKKAIEIPYAGLEAYAQLTLPYYHKKDNIVKSVDPNDKEYWTNFLNERRKERAAAAAEAAKNK